MLFRINNLLKKIHTKSTRKINLVFIEKGKEINCLANVGNSLLQVAWDNNILLEGACDGTQCCSTCHVYIEDEYINSIPLADDDELDILDLVTAPKDNSRLACAINVSEKLDGIRISVPDEVSNLIK